MVFKKKTPEEEALYEQQKKAYEEAQKTATEPIPEVKNPFIKEPPKMPELDEGEKYAQEITERIATSPELWYKTQTALMQEEIVSNTREILKILRKFDK